MFPGGYFSKTYFAGTYWPPADGGSIIDTADFPFRPMFRPRRR